MIGQCWRGPTVAHLVRRLFYRMAGCRLNTPIAAGRPDRSMSPRSMMTTGEDVVGVRPTRSASCGMLEPVISALVIFAFFFLAGFGGGRC